MVGVGFEYGSLSTAKSQEFDPNEIGDGVEDFLNEAEDIVNAVAPSLISEVRSTNIKRVGFWSRLWRRNR